MKVPGKTVLEHCQLKNGLAAGGVRCCIGEKNGPLCKGTFFGHTSLAASQVVATHFDIQFCLVACAQVVPYYMYILGTTYLYLEHTRHIFIQKVCFVFVYIL